MRGVSPVPILRVARPTNDIDALLPFYRDGLGFDILYRFEGHDGFDGVIMGVRGAPYHVEFTKAQDHAAGDAPSMDDFLVFYLPDEGEWDTSVNRMKSAGFFPVPAFDLYWDRLGLTFPDPNGYRVVLQRSTWDA